MAFNDNLPNVLYYNQITLALWASVIRLLCTVRMSFSLPIFMSMGSNFRLTGRKAEHPNGMPSKSQPYLIVRKLLKFFPKFSDCFTTNNLSSISHTARKMPTRTTRSEEQNFLDYCKQILEFFPFYWTKFYKYKDPKVHIKILIISVEKRWCIIDTMRCE